MPASAVYQGWVRHRRFRPVHHTFRYPLFLMDLDLDELPGLFDGQLAWSARRPALAWFRRADHLGDPHRPLREAVLDVVEQRTGSRPDGPVRVLTSLRHLGLAFNPVSFHYCFRRSGELEALVADVTNTPWGERHSYVLGRSDMATADLSGRMRKEFHVSPLLDMDTEYVWRATQPAAALQVHIESRDAGDRIFDATLSLRRHEIEPALLRRLLLRTPVPAISTLARIYGQALRLRLRGAPYHPHPRSRSSPRRPAERPGEDGVEQRRRAT
jgi:DUF1365 family protein